jgi:hypothetical protein
MIKHAYETFPLVIPGQTLNEAKAVLLIGLKRRVAIGPVYDVTESIESATRIPPEPDHAVDEASIRWTTYTHGGTTSLQATYEWEEFE